MNTNTIQEALTKAKLTATMVVELMPLADNCHDPLFLDAYKAAAIADERGSATAAALANQASLNYLTSIGERALAIINERVAKRAALAAKAQDDINDAKLQGRD